ncbi:MAG: hypothetical protein WDZ76_07060 [Pseudohongiellaceae bacterium]
MKIIVSAMTLLLGATGGYGWYLYQQTAAKDAQLARYASHVEDLMTQVENNTRRRLDMENQVEALSDQLRSSGTQLTNLSRQLEAAQARIDPDYEQLEQRIRETVSREYEQRSPAPSVTARTVTPTDLVREFTQMDPMEQAALMSVGTQYRNFLDALEVSDERLDEIIDGLIAVTAEQNRARQDLLQQRMVFNPSQNGGRPTQPDPAVLEDMRRQMVELANPEATREALSYYLTDEELELFSRVQEPVTAGFRAFSSDGDAVRLAPFRVPIEINQAQ